MSRFTFRDDLPSQLGFVIWYLEEGRALARDLHDIKEQLALAEERVVHGSEWPALSYEEGVVATITWFLELTNEAPMDEDGHEEG